MQFTRAWTRILLPFHLRTTDASRTLDETSNLNEVVVVCGEETHTAHSAYFLEYLPQVHRFLFDGAGESGCQYAKLAVSTSEQLPASTEVWLGNLRPAARNPGMNRPSPRGLQLVGAKDEIVWKTPEPFEAPAAQLRLRASFDANSGIELWLSRMGVGIVSLSLLCEPTGEPTDDPLGFFNALLELNHAMATAQKAVWLRGAGDQQPTHLLQITRDMLRPLWENATAAIDFELRGMAFTALEATVSKDGNAAQLTECQQELSRLLPHLAQLHPPSHPGATELGRANRMLFNNEHLCFIDQAGAAHGAIVEIDASDVEDPGDNYSRDRLRRVQMEYFPGFLLAAIQRLCLQRILDESTATSTLPAEQQDAAREALLEKVLRFGLEGEFVQVAWRTTVQKHHELAQHACEVQEGLRTARHAMTDFNRMATSRAAERQRKEAERAAMDRHAETERQRQEAERVARERHEETERAERTMHLLEVFIVTFYSLEMAHVLGESIGFPHNWKLAALLGGVALATFWGVAGFVRWRGQRHSAAPGGTPARRQQSFVRTVFLLFVIVTAIQGGFLGLNYWFNPPSSKPARENGEHASLRSIFPIVRSDHSEHRLFSGRTVDSCPGKTPWPEDIV